MSAAARPLPVLLAAALLLLPALVLPAAATSGPAAPALETLRDGDFEGVPGEGYALRHEGAQRSLVARTGLASVDLARGGATLRPDGVLGALDAHATHAVPVALLRGLALHVQAPRGAALSLALLLPVDADGDGAVDRCLAHDHAGPFPESGAWVALALDGAAPFREADAACAGGATRTLSAIAADASNAGATVRGLVVESRGAPGTVWPAGQPLLVDDASLLAASSTLVRIREAHLNQCGGASFATPQDALACAAEGATVLVAPGTYAGPVVVARSATLCAAPAGATACDPTQSASTVLRGGGATVVALRAEGAILRGFTLENPAYAATDAAGAPVAPSLVAVEADRVQMLDNRLLKAAAPLAPGQSRQSTAAVTVLAGSDDVEIRRNAVEAMPASALAEASCRHAPCRTLGVDHKGGERLVVADNRFDMAGAGHAAAVQLAGGNATLARNAMLLGASTTGAPTVGIRGAVPLHHANLTGNQVRRADDAAVSLVGIRAALVAPTLADNAFHGLAEGVQLEGGSGGALRLRGHAWRDTPVTLRLLTDTSGLHVDARENDWGAYAGDAIRASLRDEGAANAVDVTCFVRDAGAALACGPRADFAMNVTAPSWRRPVHFVDASTEGGAPIRTRAWTFSDGGAASGPDVVRAFDQPGPATATLTLTDENGFTSTLTRALAIQNAAPQLAPVGDRLVAEADTLVLHVAATDADGDAVALDATGLPEGASFDAATGAFRWTPGYDDEGQQHAVSFHATDGLLHGWENVTLTVGHGNAPPALALEGAFSGREGETFRFNASATDPDGGPLRLRAYVLPPGATWDERSDGTATFTWTPGHDQAGDHALAVTADDGEKVALHELTLRVADVNRPPSLAPIPDKTVAEAATLEFFLTPSDPDGGQGLALSMGPAPRAATFNASNGLFSWTPRYDQAGDHAIEFTVHDGEATARVTARILVTHTNRAPDVSPLLDQVVKAGRELRFPVFAVDPDGDAITFSVTPHHAGMSIVNGVFRWRPGPEMMGTHVLTLTVSDGRLTDSSVLNVDVTENLPPQASFEGPARPDVGAPAAFRAAGFDPDGSQPLRYEWDFDARDGFQVQYVGPEVSYAFPATGPRTVTLRASDADGLHVTRTLDLTVDDAIHLTLALTPPAGLHKDRLALALLADWQGAPLADATLDVETWYDPDDATPPTPMKTFRVRTDEHGRAIFGLPKDLAGLVDLPGRHRLVVRATVEDSYLGDAERADASVTYGGML